MIPIPINLSGLATTAIPTVGNVLGANVHKTQHTVEALFLPWDRPAFRVRTEIISYSCTKRIGDLCKWQLGLLPMRDDVRRPWMRHYAYVDKYLRADDWVWVQVDAGDGIGPEVTVIGMIDRVGRTVVTDERGVRRTAIVISGTGWEKALDKLQVFNDPLLNLGVAPPVIYSLLEGYVAPMAEGTPVTTFKVAKLIPAMISAMFTRVRFLPLGSDASLVERQVSTVAQSARYTDTASLYNELPSFGPTGTALPNGVPGAGEGQDDVHVEEPVPGLPGQENGGHIGLRVPHLNIPVSELIQYAIDPDLTDRAFIEPDHFIGHFGSSALKLISSLSNPAINEVILDVRKTDDNLAGLRPPIPGISCLDGLPEELHTALAAEAMELALATVIGNATVAIRSSRPIEGMVSVYGDYMPHVILRQRPLFRRDMVRLPAQALGPDQGLINLDIGRSDADLANAVFLESRFFANEAVQRVWGNLSQYIDQSSVTRHGLRFLRESVYAVPGDWNSADPVAALADWRQRLYDAHRFNETLYNGTATFRKLLRSVALGTAIILKPTQPERDGPQPAILAYVEGITHNWSYPGVFTTTIEFTRGYEFPGGGRRR